MFGLIKDKLKLGSRDERKDALPLPSGLLALSSSHDGLLRVWDERGRCAMTLAGHDKAVYTVMNLPDGRVASGGYDKCIRIWNLRTGRCETVIRGHADSIFCLKVFFVDREAANRASASAAAASATNVSAPAISLMRPTPAFKIVSSSSDKTVKIWNGHTYKCEQTLSGHTGSILSMVQVSDTLIATGSLDKTIRVWSLEKNRCELTMSGHLSSVSGLAVLDDNTKLASCSYDETIKLWSISVPASSSDGDVAKFQLEKSIRGHTSAIMNILHLPATATLPQRLVTCSRDLNIKVWCILTDPSTAALTLRCLSNITSHRNDINNLCVLSDARTLVSCSSDCMVKTFDLEKTGNVTTSELSITNTNQDGKAYTVYSVCPLPDSRRTPRKAMQNVAVEEWEPHPHQQPPPQIHHQPQPQQTLPRKPSQPQLAPRPMQPVAIDPNAAAAAPRPVPRSSPQPVVDGAAREGIVPPPTPPTNSIATADDPSYAPLDADSDLDDDERNVVPLSLKPDVELDAPLCRVVQKYRLKHYLNYGDLMDEGFYDDGGVVWVTTSHVARTAPQRPVPQAKPQPPKISLNNRLSYASPPPANSAASSTTPMSPTSSSTPSSSAASSSSSTSVSAVSAVAAAASPPPSTFRPYKQWMEETIVLDARFDHNLRSTTEEAKRLLAGVSDLKARIMLLALFVSNKLGGGPRDIVKEWQTTITKLKKIYGHAPPTNANGGAATGASASSAHGLVLPIGSLIGRVGLSRHRALLFKYLCDQTVLFPENWAPPLPQGQHVQRPFNLTISPMMSPMSGSVSVPMSPVNPQLGTTGGNTPVPNDFSLEPISQTAPNKSFGFDSRGDTNTSPATSADRMPMHAPMTPLGIVAQLPSPMLRGLSHVALNDDGDDPEVERTCRVTGRSRSGSDAQLNVPQPPTSNSPNRQPHSTPCDPMLYPSIHCRLMRGQYEYHFPRGALRARARPNRNPRTWEESWEDQEAGYSRHQDGAGSSKTFHAWVVVELQGGHYVVDLSYEPSQLYLESSKEAAHYNRGRLGDVRKTGLTAAPLRSLHEVKWHELTDLVLLRDGGFGRVERAKFRGMEVVVKTPLSLDSYILKTFMEEAQVLNLLSHPNIVKLVGVCTEKKAIVLDFVQGGDLHTFIKTQAILAHQYQQQRLLGQVPAGAFTPLSMLERLDMCIQTATGMQYLHLSEPMITHRDLKTLNLLVCTVKYHPDDLSPSPPPAHLRRGGLVQKRIIKVCDFGLARNQHHDDGISTQHKDVGTPAFQSPEQWRDDEEERLTTATDVYSFGGIMMEILTDRMPWHTEKSKYAIYQHVMVDRRLPPIPDDAHLHPKLIECIHACHQFEPAARPTFPDVLRVLREVSDEIEEELDRAQLAEQLAAAAR